MAAGLVSPVHVHLPAVFVDDCADLFDIVLEHSVRGRIRNHQAGEAIPVLRRFLPQVVDIHVAVGG